MKTETDVGLENPVKHRTFHQNRDSPIWARMIDSPRIDKDSNGESVEYVTDRGRDSRNRYHRYKQGKVRSARRRSARRRSARR